MCPPGCAQVHLIGSRGRSAEIGFLCVVDKVAPHAATEARSQELATCQSLQGGGPLTSTGRRSRPRPGASKQARNQGSEQAASVTKSRSSLDASRTPRSVTQSVTPSVISQPSRAVTPVSVSPARRPLRARVPSLPQPYEEYGEGAQGGKGISTSGPASRWQKPPTKPRQLRAWRLHQRLLPPSQGARSSGQRGLTSPLINRWAGPHRPH